MKIFKLFLFFFTIIFFISNGFSVETINSGGHFTISFEDNREMVYNDEINSVFLFDLKNNLDESQEISISVPRRGGWDILINGKKNNDLILLNANEQENIEIEFVANSEFDYSQNIVTPEMIKIGANEEYMGSFNFPIFLSNGEHNVSFIYIVDIEKRDLPPLRFEPKISNEKLSPVNPLGFSINALNILDSKNVSISVILGNYILDEFEDIFSPDMDFKVYQKHISNNIYPDFYEVKLIVRKMTDDGVINEWRKDIVLKVEKYVDLLEDREVKSNFFSDTYYINLKNNGNSEISHIIEVPRNFFKDIFLLFRGNIYEKHENYYKIVVDLDIGESKTISYSYNYLALYLFFIAIFILFVYIYNRKTSNPLDVETKIYDIKKVEHEGIKSLKIKIGVENIKAHEIETLRLIFRMPSYLSIKDGTFLLTEPQHVLKGKNQYKMTWEFRRFEMDDSRIIGFTMVNSKGVLGDIIIPDLELEVKINGKIRKYYASFPIVKG